MQPRPIRLLVLAALLAGVVVACDDDPTAPIATLSLVCPTGPLAVNAPIALNFSQPVQASTVTGANVVVTDAGSGLEIPGALALGADGRVVTFSPSSPLPFGTVLGIRAQNILTANRATSLGVVLCNVLTAPPPIAEVVWDRLDSPTGTALTGASLISPDSGWVSSFAVPLYRRVGRGWEVRFNQPYFISSFDVQFASALHGWATHFDSRNLRGVITETRNGGTSFDTAFTMFGRDIRRLLVDSAAFTGNTLFALAGGGTNTNATFFKRNPGNGAWSMVTDVSGTSSIHDIDHAPNDTTTLFAVSSGFRIGPPFPATYAARTFTSTNGGASWTEVPNARADTGSTVAFHGVARRTNGDVYVTGGNGFVGRLPGGNAPFTKINLGIVSRDTLDFNALIYNDVQFAPDNNNIGWIVGAQLIGFSGGVPQYQGLVFGTKDGGATWTRQGVRGADEYGASFPALNQLEVLSSTKVWIVGDGGTVLSLNP
ncbi:MAG TPA: Ig-like domain-containing protein [Gemmatimonadaceae bacterium]|nr:Ig-like domain-containing protein [Gemmatimonadaceae bacterium]